MGSQGSKNKGAKQSPEKTKKKKKKAKGTFTVLTLGISGSGKSTFAKQMKILYCGGFSDEEKTSYRAILVNNLLVGMQELVKQAEKLELQPAEANLRRARYFKEMSTVDVQWNQEIAEKIRELWKDPAIQRTWAKAPEYQLQISMLDYHISKLDSYLLDTYVPTNEDMLQARQRTTGCVETVFEIDKNEWVLLDVGGQLPERAKWEPVLNERQVNAIIFFAALDEFNMASSEQQGKTKMHVALETFAEVTSSEKATEGPIVLFLNKSDLFEKKILSQKGFESFKATFPSYTGPQNLEGTSEFVVNLFLEKVKKKESKKGRAEEEKIYTHVTCALDTETMKTVFTAVRDNLFISNMFMGGVQM